MIWFVLLSILSLAIVATLPAQCVPRRRGRDGFFFPCGACCGCDIFTDAFGGTLDSWEQIAGTWAITGGKLTASGSNARILVEDVDISSGRITLNILGDEGSVGVPGDSARVIIGWTDSSNYTYIDFQFGGYIGPSAIEIAAYRVVAGVTSLLTFRTRDGNQVTIFTLTGEYKVFTTVTVWNAAGGNLTICWDETELVLTIADEVAYFQGHGYSGRVGLGTGVVNTDLTFDNFDVDRDRQTNTACPLCRTCGEGCEGELPEEIEMTFNADALTGGTCAAAVNGNTFVLERTTWDRNACRADANEVGANSVNNSSACWYSYDAGSLCDSNYTLSIRAEFRASSTGGTELIVYVIFTHRTDTDCVHQFCCRYTTAGGISDDCLGKSYDLTAISCATAGVSSTCAFCAGGSTNPCGAGTFGGDAVT